MIRKILLKRRRHPQQKKALTMNIPTVFSDTIFKILSYAPPFGKGDVTKNSCPKITHSKLSALIPSKKSSPLDF